MKHLPNGKEVLKFRIICIVVLAFVLLMMMQFANYPNLVERYYSKGFYIFICYLLHPVVNVLPFSLGDLLYIVIIIYLIYALIWLVKSVFKRAFKEAGLFLLKLIIGIQTAILIFYLFWGLNYFRPSAAKILSLQDSSYSLTDITNVTSMLIDSANKCRESVTPLDLQQSNPSIYLTAKQAINKLSDSTASFHTYKPDIKPSLLTPLLNYIGTSGYYNPFTGEAQINYQMPVFLRPFVACHEMSHQMGFGAEDEANFVGFIAGIHSQNHLLRYSAYFLGVQEFMHALHHRDSVAYKRLKKQISRPLHLDFKTDRDYWIAFENKAGALSSILYDNFLKANNQPYGLNTYNQMITLVMAMYKKQGNKVSLQPGNIHTNTYLNRGFNLKL